MSEIIERTDEERVARGLLSVTKALIRIRNLAHRGMAREASDLADWSHNLPGWCAALVAGGSRAAGIDRNVMDQDNDRLDEELRRAELLIDQAIGKAA